MMGNSFDFQDTKQAKHCKSKQGLSFITNLTNNSLELKGRGGRRGREGSGGPPFLPVSIIKKTE
jgi:hypothetical protein